MARIVEICVADLASAEAAERGGADRIELCADLDSGGTTPSAGLIAEAVARLAIPVHVLIRPRAGDFQYDGGELAVMLRDVEVARAAGAAGVVVGALVGRASIDAEVTTRLVDRARPMSVTFHRAIDLVADTVAGLDVLIRVGVDRVLSSGGPGRAADNLAGLREMVAQAAGRVAILAGGGVAEGDLPRLLDETGVREVHLGSGVVGPRPEPGPFGRTPAPVEAARVARVVARVRGGAGDGFGTG